MLILLNLLFTGISYLTIKGQSNSSKNQNGLIKLISLYLLVIGKQKNLDNYLIYRGIKRMSLKMHVLVWNQGDMALKTQLDCVIRQHHGVGWKYY